MERINPPLKEGDRVLVHGIRPGHLPLADGEDVYANFYWTGTIDEADSFAAVIRPDIEPYYSINRVVEVINDLRTLTIHESGLVVVNVARITRINQVVEIITDLRMLYDHSTF